MKVEVPQYEPSAYKKKNTYNNHNQINIVGSATMSQGFPNMGGGTDGPSKPSLHAPLSPGGGLAQMKNATSNDFARQSIPEEPEENIMFLAGIGGIPGTSS